MCQIEDGISKAKLKRLSQDDERQYLARMKVITCKRGSQQVFTKTDVRETSYRAYDITMTTFDPTEQPELLPSSRKPGASEKVAEVLRCIVSHMPSHKRIFWEDLAREQNTKTPKRVKRQRSAKSLDGRKKGKAQ